MRVTIKFDTLETEYPNMIAEAARNLMLASRGITTDTVVSETESDPVEPEMEDTVATSPRSDAVEVTAPRKRGRKSNAEKAAEAAAEPVVETEQSATVTAPSTPAPPLFQPSPTNTMPLAANATPAFTPPATAAGPMPSGPAAFTPPSSAQPQAPAMPNPGAAPTGHEFTFEDLREVVSAANRKAPGSAFQVMRRRTWQDGSEKAPWAVLDQVPADQRERLAGEICSEFGL